jgi:hypothetical protein
MVRRRHPQTLEQSRSTGARTSGAEPPPGPDLASWRGLLLTGAGAAVASVALTAVQVVVFATHPPPQTIEGVMQLMQRNPLLGLVSLDILICVNNVLVALIYLALAAALFQTARSLVTIALGLGMLGIAAYLGSNPAVELLLLSREHARAPSGQRAALLAAGDGLLTTWRGTAYLSYYFLSAAALILFAVAMLRTDVFSQATGRWALASGLLMTVPSTFGPVGIGFSLLSLVPWCVMCLLVAQRAVQLARPASQVGRASASSRASRSTVARSWRR